MARYTGSKNKLSRSLGVDIFGKGDKLKKANILPGGRRPRKISEYGRQLKSKQTVKHLYGVGERQFRNYIKKALKLKGDPGQNLIILLENRLDNVVYRIGWAKTRPAARQIVGHEHILVNGEIQSIPSYETKVGDEIRLDEKISDKDETKELINDKEVVPSWISRQNFRAEVMDRPKTDEVVIPVAVSDIIEFYSR